MKVWLVSQGSYSQYSVEYACATEEVATELAAALNLHESTEYNDPHFVEERDFFTAAPEVGYDWHLHWKWTPPAEPECPEPFASGRVGEFEGKVFPIRPHWFEPASSRPNGELWVQGSDHDRERLLKSASDVLAEQRAIYEGLT